jgi:AbiU2
MTAEELEKRNIEKMGEPLGKQYSALYQEVAILHLYWKEYTNLFGTNQERIDRLNQTAPGFFRMLQDELLLTNVLHIARLTDPPKSGAKSPQLPLCYLLREFLVLWVFRSPPYEPRPFVSTV